MPTAEQTADEPISLVAFRQRRQGRTPRPVAAKVVSENEARVAERLALEELFGRFHQFLLDFQKNGLPPYLILTVDIPRKLEEIEKRVWLQRGASSIEASVCPGRDPTQPERTHEPTGLHLTRVTMPLTAGVATELLRGARMDHIRRSLGVFRETETSIADQIVAHGLDTAVDPKDHPEYNEIFGSAGMCFSIWVSNRHPDPEQPYRHALPMHLVQCRNIEDVRAADFLIQDLTRKSVLAANPNVIDLTAIRGGPRM